MVTRKASHAGSWYTANGKQLSQQLDDWLDDVPSTTTPIGTTSSQQGDVSIPTQNARAIIAPHAGYSYSGPAAAWAYKSADWANATRIFLLGPSHHHYLTGAATTGCDTYATPLGDLSIDTALVEELKETWDLETMSRRVDEEEHSLEMHLPYIYKMLSLHNEQFQSSPASVPLLPLLIGNTSPSTESTLGALLSPYLSSPTTLFIISSDFCHWGPRFRYTYYAPPSGSPVSLKSSSKVPEEWPIHESIAKVDKESMDAVESGRHGVFLEQLRESGNTVCGRHPIGVFMAAVEKLNGGGESGEVGGSGGSSSEGNGKMKFVRYERSGLVEDVGDSSVSYASAFAVL